MPLGQLQKRVHAEHQAKVGRTPLPVQLKQRVDRVGRTFAMETSTSDFDAYLEHAGFLRRLAGGLVRDEHDRDDLVQEAWAAALSVPPHAEDRPESVRAWRVTPAGTEGYRTAEVTLGGVDTGGLSSKSMESRLVPNLYFVGEAVDVTGWLGGYNFQWAWSSGWAAGTAIAERG